MKTIDIKDWLKSRQKQTDLQQIKETLEKLLNDVNELKETVDNLQKDVNVLKEGENI